MATLSGIKVYANVDVNVDVNVAADVKVYAGVHVKGWGKRKLGSLSYE